MGFLPGPDVGNDFDLFNRPPSSLTQKEIVLDMRLKTCHWPSAVFKLGEKSTT